MPLATTSAGANVNLAVAIVDPGIAANQANVAAFQLSDGQSLAGLYALLVGNTPLLLTPGSTFSRQLATVGAPGVPVTNTEGTKATYSAGVIGFTPTATPTDFFSVVGNSKVTRVTRLTISGFATSAISVDVQLIKRTTANTGGTPSAVTFAQHDSNDAAPVTTVNTWTANPTLGTGVNVRAAKLNLGATGSAGTIEWIFTTRNSRGIVLRGTAQSLNLNWNGAAVPSGTLLDIDVEITEE